MPATRQFVRRWVATHSGSTAGDLAGDFLDETLDLSDLDSPAAARTNLGLGNAAVRNVGTAAGTVAAGDDSRIVGAAQKASNLSDLASAGTARTNLGLGNVDNTADVDKPVSTAQATADGLRLLKASNLSDVASASTARTNLGLGGAATLSVGTTAGTVAAGDDSRITGAAQKAANLSDLASASTARTNLGLGGAAVLSVGTTAGTVMAGDDSRVVAVTARTTAQATTGSLANGASENLSITLAKGYRLLAISTSRAARVRLYTTSAARTADASRATTSDPASDAGVVLDYVTADTATYTLSPLVDGANQESSPSSSISMAVTNQGTTGTVTVTLTYIATEV